MASPHHKVRPFNDIQNLMKCARQIVVVLYNVVPSFITQPYGHTIH